MHILKNASRRQFLRQAGAMSAMVGTAAPLALNLSAMSNAAAQTASDYKAIVCLFFYGGNDAFNMFLPTDAASFSAYTSVRNQAPDSIALLAPGTVPVTTAMIGSPARLGGVLPITPTNAQGRTYALHPLMGSLQAKFNTSKRLAVVSNIGPLITPLSKAQYAQTAYPKPAQLFSHNDQANTWQAMGPEGVTKGWGGRMGDMLASLNSTPTFTAVSAAGNAVFAAGNTVQQYQVATSGAITLGLDGAGQVYGSAAAGGILQRVVGTARGSHVFEADVSTVSRRAIDAELILRNAMLPSTDGRFGTAPASGSYIAANDPKLRYPYAMVPNLTAPNALAQQFQVVARMIEAGMRGATGAKRQVFFVSMGGFDTHAAQNFSQSDLYAKIDHALNYFDTALAAINAQNNVTTFTASDFGRTFTSNGNGTDHGWGSHHLVMGGAVKGGDIYGKVPTLGVKNANDNNFNSSPDQLGNGVLLPTTSVDQLGATLGRWMGLSDTQLLTVFPNLANFDASVRNLGFMNA